LMVVRLHPVRSIRADCEAFTVPSSSRGIRLRTSHRKRTDGRSFPAAAVMITARAGRVARRARRISPRCRLSGGAAAAGPAGTSSGWGGHLSMRSRGSDQVGGSVTPGAGSAPTESPGPGGTGTVSGGTGTSAVGGAALGCWDASRAAVPGAPGRLFG
jgi:hypothetical protein